MVVVVDVVVVDVVDVVATIMTRFISLLKATLKDYVSHSNDHPLCNCDGARLGISNITYPKAGQHSTEVAFALLIQQPWV